MTRRRAQALVRWTLAVCADVSRADEARVMVEHVVGECGRIDILADNAGSSGGGFREIAESEWDAVLDTTLKGCFLVTQAVAREMVKRRNGVIINMSSIGQQLAGPTVTHYSASKGGLAQFTRQAALELVDHGIRINAICPGLIEIDMNRGDIQQEERRKARLRVSGVTPPVNGAGQKIQRTGLTTTPLLP